jgi:hypothetical protein
MEDRCINVYFRSFRAEAEVRKWALMKKNPKMMRLKMLNPNRNDETT